MSCKMCGQNIRQERVIYEYIQLENLIKFLPDNIEDINICLWGGEPLLYPYINELLYELKKRKCYKGIITNGYYLNKYIDEIIDADLTYLTVSIDGDKKTHNSIRNVSDAYDRAIRNIKILVKEKEKRNIGIDEICININFTILGDNIHNMYEIANLGKDIGCKSITYNFPIIMNSVACEKFSMLWQKKYKDEFRSWRGYCNNELDVDCNILKREIERIKAKFDKDKTFNVFWSTNNMELSKTAIYDYFYHIESEFGKKICNLSKNTIVINSNEDLLLCPDFTETVVGNIREQNFEEYVLQVEKNNMIKELEGRMPICARCCHRVW